MSRPNVTDKTVDGLRFARACVLDQRVASHARDDHSWDDSYRRALEALDEIVMQHAKSARSALKRAVTTPPATGAANKEGK